MFKHEKWLDDELYDISMRLRLVALSVLNASEGYANPLEKQFYENIADCLNKSSDNISEARISLANVIEKGFKND